MTPSEPASDEFVPFTARLMAAMRAQETNRPDRLFSDPFAAVLAGEEAVAMMQQRLSDNDLTYVAVRTRFFDDFLLSSPARQVVLLAAGMDTRAFRLPWNRTVTCYELDQPAVLNYKNAMLSEMTPPCQRHTIPVDLTQPWMPLLLDQGYQPDQPSIWLIEGLLMYLSDLDMRKLLHTVSDLAALGSRLGLDVVNSLSLDYAPYKGYFRSGVDEPEPLLAEYGWDAVAVQPGDKTANYGRYQQRLPPRDVLGVQRAFLVTAERR